MAVSVFEAVQMYMCSFRLEDTSSLQLDQLERETDALPSSDMPHIADISFGLFKK
jgi:hypothetical protein